MNTLTSNHISNFDSAVHEIYCVSQILVTTGGLELRTSYIKSSYLTH